MIIALNYSYTKNVIIKRKIVSKIRCRYR